MAEYLEFVCKNCGWSICAPAEGSDVNMDSIVAYFKCLDCNKVFGRSYDMGSVVNDPEICPKCGSSHTVHQGLYCLED